jgi:hypothetical protein
VHAMEFLLTWNCAHLANLAEVRRIREEIAAKCGYDHDRILEYCRQQAREIRERWAQAQRAPTHEESTTP